MKDNLFEYIRGHSLNKRFFMFIMGVLVSALSFNLFYLPYNIIPTGSSGLALLLSHFISIPVANIIFLLDFFLFLIGLFFYGYKYGFKYFIVTLIYPIFLSFTSLIVRYIDFGNVSLFLIVVLGGITMGFASGLIRNSGFSPGGFAVIFDILHDKLFISYGMGSNIINAILIISSGFLFGIDRVLYAFIGMILSSYVVDRVVIGISNNKVFYIVTDRPYEIRDLIVGKFYYSVTVLNGRGGYKGKKKKILMCVVPTIEYINLKKMVHELDKDAFFLITDVYDSSVKKNCKNM